MKIDPNFCTHSGKFWAILHDLIAHPLMAVSFYSKISIRFHNYTSSKAWPR